MVKTCCVQATQMAEAAAEAVRAELQMHSQQAEDWKAQHHAVQEQLHEARRTATTAAQVFHCLAPSAFL